MKIFKNVVVTKQDGTVVTPKKFQDSIEHHNGSWTLVDPLYVEIVYTESGVYKSQKLPVPTYWWDGASIPKLFRRIIGDPLDIEFAMASFVHDLLYDLRYNRMIADDCFLKLLQSTRFKDVPKWKEYVMYYAVRLGGQAHYALRSNPKSLIDKVGKLGWKIVKSVI